MHESGTQLTWMIWNSTDKLRWKNFLNVKNTRYTGLHRIVLTLSFLQ